MLADGHFEGMYKGERVAISSLKGCVHVFVGGVWRGVKESEVDVLFTLRRFNDSGELEYFAGCDTLSHKNLPKSLPSCWLVAS